MIVAGETSGDLHGGALASALFKLSPSLYIYGFGGNAMRRAGVDVIFDVERLAVVGIIEVFLHLKSVMAAYRCALSHLRKGVDLLILIDYPDFNLRLAKSAKKLGIPVVYYIGPQVWAWRPNRMKTIRKWVDKMLVILPFEKRIYDAAGVPCEFVGHPLLDQRPPSEMQRTEKAAYLISKGLNPSGVTIGLLPGSRKGEVAALLPAMLRAAALLAKETPNLQVIIPIAPNLSEELILDLAQASDFPICCVTGEIHQVLSVCDLIVVASGTATLQAAIAQTPMVIVYKLSWLTYRLARKLVRLKSIGLVNIIAGTSVVPELVQAEVRPERICEEVERLLHDNAACEKMKQGLMSVAARLGNAGASDRAAVAIFKFLEEATLTRGLEREGAL